jgi:hypothetical protein
MELEVFSTSFEVSRMVKAMSVQAQLEILVSFFDGDTDLLEHSKLISKEDLLGCAITIPNLAYSASCKIVNPTDYLFHLASDLRVFRAGFIRRLAEYQDDLLCSIIEDIDKSLMPPVITADMFLSW